MVVVILLPYDTLYEMLEGQRITSYWNIENINDPRPFVIGFIGLTEEELYEEFQEQVDFMIEMHPHSIVEIDPDMGVSWFTMYDDEDDADPWKL